MNDRGNNELELKQKTEQIMGKNKLFLNSVRGFSETKTKSLKFHALE